MNHPPLPAHLRALAEHKRVVAPEYEWTKFLARNGDAVPEKNLEERFGRWLTHAKKHPDPELEASKPRGSNAPTPTAEWQEPDEWRQARELAASGEIDNAGEARKLLEMLNAMGGKRIEAVVETPGKPLDPVCSACGRICLVGETIHVTCKQKPHLAAEAL